MIDPMEALRAAQPMPRGERLATWWEPRGTFGALRALGWSTICARYASNRRWARMGYVASLPADTEGIRRHARPLRLAREVAAQRLAQARHWREQAKAAEAEMLRLRAAVPTREEVERAVDALLEARRRAVEATPRTVHGAFDALSAGRDALVALATRGRG